MSSQSCYNKNRIPIVLLGVGILARIVFFVINLAWIDGLHIDEAMTVLNAYSLADSGTDMLGNSLPVYFNTWITGGQSPVSTYLCALSVLLLGKSLFAIRLPALVIGIVGMTVFFRLSELLFDTKEEQHIAMGLMAISPWFIFSSIYVLDCNFLAYMLIFAFYYLALGIKKQKWYPYVLSMLFFALGFNSYIASVLIIPIFLVVAFVVLLKNGAIDVPRSALCVISLVIFSLSFILLGLVTVGAIPEFQLGPISFGNMSRYNRIDSVALFNGNGLFGCISNLAGSLAALMCTDVGAIFAIGPNRFLYGNCLSGVMLFLGMHLIIKHRKSYNKPLLAILAGSIAAILMFSVMNSDTYYAFAYRYGVLSPMLLLIEAVGAYHILTRIKSKRKKEIYATYLAISLATFCAIFATLYPADTNKALDITYGDSFLSSVEYCEDKDKDSQLTILCSDYELQRRASIYARCYYYDDKSILNFYDEYTDEYENNRDSIELTDHIALSQITSDTMLNDELYIIPTSDLSTVMSLQGYDDYRLIDNGCFSVLEKK